VPITSLVVCESLIWERENNLPTAIRILDAIRLAPNNAHVRFFSLLTLHETGVDFISHSAVIQIMAPDGSVPAAALPHRFVYGRKIDPGSPAGFHLGTEFNFEAKLLGTYWVQASVDSAPLTQVPFLVTRTP